MDKREMQEWDSTSKPLSARDQLLYYASLSLLQQCNFNETDSVLQIGLGIDNISEKLAENMPEGSLIAIDYYEMPKILQNDAFLEEQKDAFDAEILFWNLLCLELNYIDIIQFMFDSLKEKGHFYSIFPTINTTTRNTYQQVVNTGQFPKAKLGPSFTRLDNQRISVSNIIKEHLSDVTQTKYHGGITLPCIEVFSHYLNEVSELYIDTLPSETKEQIIDKQVELFETYCNEKYDGRLIFEYECDIIHAIKS